MQLKRDHSIRLVFYCNNFSSLGNRKQNNRRQDTNFSHKTKFMILKFNLFSMGMHFMVSALQSMHRNFESSLSPRNTNIWIKAFVLFCSFYFVDACFSCEGTIGNDKIISCQMCFAETVPCASICITYEHLNNFTHIHIHSTCC